MRPAIPTTAASTLLGTALGASVLALSTKALVLMIAGMVGVALATSSVATYYALVTMIPVQVDFIGGLTITKLLIPFCLLVVCFNALIGRGPWPTLTAGPAGYLAGGFFFALPVSLILEGQLIESFAEAATFAVYASLFFLTLTFNRTPDQFRRLLWVIAIAGTVEAIITAAQVHYGFVMPGDWRKTIASQMGGDGDPNGAFSAILDGKIRAEGTTVHPIMLASYYLMTIPCTTCLFLTEESRSRRFLLAGMIAAMSYGWFYTFARSSMIGFAVMFTIAISLYFKAARTATFVAMALFLTGFVGYQTISEPLSTGIQTVEGHGWFANADINAASSSWQFRIESILGGWNLFWAHPWFGVGAGQAMWHYMKYLPAWANHPSHPGVIHNVFLEVASELGIFAFTAFIGLWVLAFVCVKHGLRVPALRQYAVLMCCILLGQMAFLMITPMVREIWLTLPMAISLGYMHRQTTYP